MTPGAEKPRWAAKVPREKIRRLYVTDAQGIIDAELIDAVGWALWQRCDSILTVTAAHYGHVRCPACATIIECQNHWSLDELVTCGNCDWQIPWADYHQTYRGKQLFGANAVENFETYHLAFPQAQTPQAKMLLIDQLIHAFHLTLTEVGRLAAANLLDGSLKEVIRFLDDLSNAGVSATGIGDSRAAWRQTLEVAPWAQIFIDRHENETPEALSDSQTG